VVQAFVVPMHCASAVPECCVVEVVRSRLANVHESCVQVPAAGPEQSEVAATYAGTGFRIRLPFASVVWTGSPLFVVSQLAGT
jgi:hypothetical protein